MKEKTPLLIVGAGPFGLSLAAYLKDSNIEHIHLGHSMDY
jgi:cation diffusion facilitator CzcD-associated flavoprotein CzcO